MNIDKEIRKILRDLIGNGYWEHINCSKECGKRTMEEENLNDHISQLKALILKTCEEDKREIMDFITQDEERRLSKTGQAILELLNKDRP